MESRSLRVRLSILSNGGLKKRWCILGIKIGVLLHPDTGAATVLRDKLNAGLLEGDHQCLSCSGSCSGRFEGFFS